MAMATHSSWRRFLTGVLVHALLLFSATFLSTIALGEGADVKSPTGPPPNAIFVFGDSYLDTGNHNKSFGAWTAPYGSTYPGTPTGRYSDGLVFTDIFASVLQMQSPIAYEQRSIDPSAPKYGMNFAVGGSGVFNPYGMLNLRGQIDQFESLAKTVYPREFLQYSLVLVGIHGNDYGAYIGKGNPISGIVTLQKLVINEMVLQLKRLNKLGFKTFYINNIQPIGCLPSSTRPDFNVCSELSNALVSVRHNQFLVTAVADLRKQLPGATFTILDQFSAFNTVLKNSANHGISESPLMPCCLGAGNATRNCGDVDPKGKPMFTVCANPAKSFFWDTVHPSQAGWTAVTKVLFPDADLEQPLANQQEL